MSWPLCERGPGGEWRSHVTLGGAIWLWGATIMLAALGVAALLVLHGRWGMGLTILLGGAGILLAVRWLVRVLGA